ncbi:hypothetical protein E4099_02350 [Streptomyces palmae]|uniref:Uncharacterized protein n=1 Tax=Streptomyces palmae TaxID=1701085 RepID=A0A4Z0HHT2_9ACTN|nr:hypothetical protein E4099_02350 [Streptomyces palmae]
MTSGDKDEWYPVKLIEKGDGRGFVAGQAKNYQSMVTPKRDRAGNDVAGPGNPFGPISLKKEPLAGIQRRPRP